MSPMFNCIALVFALSFVIVGCAGSEEDKAIDEMESLTNEMLSLVKEKGSTKAAMNSEEGKKLGEQMAELDKRTKGMEERFTPEQKDRLRKIVYMAKAELEGVEDRGSEAATTELGDPDDAIDDLESVMDDAVDLAKDMGKDAASTSDEGRELDRKGSEIQGRLEKMSLNEAQKERIKKIVTEARDEVQAASR